MTTESPPPEPVAAKGFDKKAWLDRVVVPLLGPRGDESAGVLERRLSLYSLIWRGDPPTDILVFLTSGLFGPAIGSPAARELWGVHVKRLLEAGFSFDFTREQIFVRLETGIMPVFGGDGAPLFTKDGMATVRLYRQVEPDETLREFGQRGGVNLILQIGAKFATGVDAAVAVKVFFAQWGDNALQVVGKFAPPFGVA